MGVKAQVSPFIAALGEEGRVDALGVQTRYFKAGTGPAVVLVHGLGETSVAWHANAQALAERFTVVTADMPGHGESSVPPWPYSPAEGGRWLLALMDALGIGEASLVGSSLGGLVAAEAALSAPGRARRLVLEDSAGFGREVLLALRAMTVPLLGEFIGRPSVPNLNALMRLVFHDPSRVPPGFVQALYSERNHPWNERAMLKVLRVGATPLGVKRSVLLLERARTYQAPTLVVWGRHDRVFPVSHAEAAVRAFPNATLRVFEDCGHWPHMEQPGEYNRLLQEFLS